MTAGKRTILAFENQTLTTGTLSLIAIQTAAANAAAQIVELTRLEIMQSASTTLGMIRGEIAKRDTAATLTMTATTPQPVVVGGGASGLTGNTAPAGGTARTGTNASVDSGGAFTSIRPFAFANLNGYLWKPDPEEQIIIGPSTLVVVRFLAVPATLTGWTVVADLIER